MEILRSGTHRSKVFIQEINNKKYNIVRKESDKDFIDMHKEIKFLLSLNKKQFLHFPKIIDYNLDTNPIFYTMPFYTMPTLRDSILNLKTNINSVLKLIKNIINFLVDHVYIVNLSNISSNNYIQKAHIDRVKNRLLSLLTIDQRFKRIITSDYININNKLYINILPLIDIISNDSLICNKLIPSKTHMIHGDFHFDNILYDEKDICLENFILIDPRGESSGYDFSYDLGKLWHSFHGQYDLIHEGGFSFKYEYVNDTNNINFKIKKDKKFKRMQTINCEMLEIINSFNFIKNEKNWFLKTCFAEAMHFCSLAPFHIKNNFNFAIARYAIGTILLNNFCNEYNNMSPDKWNILYNSKIS